MSISAILQFKKDSYSTISSQKFRIKRSKDRTNIQLEKLFEIFSAMVFIVHIGVTLSPTQIRIMTYQLINILVFSKKYNITFVKL